MRKLGKKNQVLFIILSLITVFMIAIFIYVIMLMLRKGNNTYELKKNSYLYNSDYEIIDVQGGLKLKKSFDGKYYLKRENNEWIDLNDSTLILYSVPDNKSLSFTGSYNVKPSYRYVTSTYSKTAKNTACGEKLLLTR